jgi:NAD+ synthase (glutamine-hydrolysing)
MDYSKNLFRIAIAQINLTVGDLDGNTSKIINYIERAKQVGADIVVFPEMAVTGYPPEDLLLRSSFVHRNVRCLQRIIPYTEGLTAVVGFVDENQDLFNAAAVISDGKLMGVHHKWRLPNYGVFDEERYFQAGDSAAVYELGDVVFGVEICEDMWYADGPHKVQALVGDAHVVIVLNSSPFHVGKWKLREDVIATRASDNLCFFVYGNLVGGQDELVFDGYSMVFGPQGQIICRGPAFEEALVLVDIDPHEVDRLRRADTHWKQEKRAFCGYSGRLERISLPAMRRRMDRPAIPQCIWNPPDRLEEIYKALVLGTRDYVEKNGFEKVVIGLSGGIDSALTTVIAVDALGHDRVVAVIMPSQYSSDATQSDAINLAKSLGIKRYFIPIQRIFDTYLETLAKPFEGTKPGVAEENIQARIRGNILMALSNKFGWLVLTTGNKSEVAVGYSTLYGDTAGGFNVLKDVYKTLVYELVNYRNSISPVIPESIIRRPPSAELRPGQKDVDTLPPYEILDPIIHAYVEEDKSISEIVAMGFEKPVVERVILMIDRNEYKRRQAPPGIKITHRAFGKDRRIPITNKYREQEIDLP